MSNPEKIKRDLKEIQDKCFSPQLQSTLEHLGLKVYKIYLLFINLFTGLTLVHARAKAMQRASEERPSGMVTVVGLRDAGVQGLCDAAKEWSLARGLRNPVAVVSNVLFPRGCVIGGDVSAVDYITRFGKSNVS